MLPATPLTTVIPMFEQDWGLVAVVVCLAGLAAIGLTIALKGGVRGKGAMLAMALDNMTQGIVMFDSRERLIVCNDRFIEMYGLSREVVKPGCTLLDVINNRKSTGSLDIDPEKYRAEILSSIKQGMTMSRVVETPDRRAISVVNRPITGREYWVGTHDDITDRILAERQSSFLMEHERRREMIETAIPHFAKASRRSCRR